MPGPLTEDRPRLLAEVVDAWHRADLDDRLIAKFAAAVERYLALDAQLLVERAAAEEALDDIAAAVAAGTTTLGDGVVELATRRSGLEEVASGARLLEVLHNQARRHARRTCDALASSIDWGAAVDTADSDELRVYAQAAGYIA